MACRGQGACLPHLPWGTLWVKTTIVKGLEDLGRGSFGFFILEVSLPLVWSPAERVTPGTLTERQLRGLLGGFSFEDLIRTGV